MMKDENEITVKSKSVRKIEFYDSMTQTIQDNLLNFPEKCEYETKQIISNINLIVHWLI